MCLGGEKQEVVFLSDHSRWTDHQPGPRIREERKKNACGDIHSISRMIHIQFCQDQMANEIQPHFPKGLFYDPTVFTVEIFPDISVYILYFLISFCCAHLTIVESKPSLYFIFEFLKITVKSHPPLFPSLSSAFEFSLKSTWPTLSILIFGFLFPLEQTLPYSLITW